ncbi:hypothetical protein HIM_05044 [Hirsutella minnesotensis 3608]|uniref:Uncharacterized protein n=1 Tax=Hirsutella minnesotensis 3608 TaxID=1043627 RepID=A0A0F7ZKS4_9HYPO|nr:hypothetical protein HIM_05044 [Hirsutella minnesotensis 3608]
MDDPSRRRRQYDPPAHRSSNPRYQMQMPSPHGNSFSSSGTERYRPAPINASPTTPRSIGVAGNYSSYYQEPQAPFSASNMSTSAMSYGSEYGSDTRGQSQSFGNYNAGMMMYNVPQPNTQTPVYDTQSFSQRQQTALPMMTPDVPSSYFNSEPGAASTPGLQHTGQSSGATPSEYQPQGAHLSYGNNLSSVGAMQQQQQSAGGSGAATAESSDYRDAALEERWLNYQRQLGTVFQDIKNGSLESACDTLLALSNWLLTQVADLGLSQDDANLHDDRIKLWNDFNHAWLALCFQQKQLMESGQQISRNQVLMSEDKIKRAGDDLIRLCDGIERHGLVDYQYGVWEEEIESGELNPCARRRPRANDKSQFWKNAWISTSLAGYLAQAMERVEVVSWSS